MERYEVVLRSFKRLPPELSADLRAGVYPVRLQRSEVIHAANDAADGIFFIEKGLVQYFEYRGKEKHILRFKAEDEFIIADKEILPRKAMETVPIPNLANFTRMSERIFKKLHKGNHLSRH